jgi:succinate-semialdehyde dehydrogenase/glutarate-semialdehyde dehydrogenase
LGNPFEEVDLGPLAKVSFAEELHKQIQDSINQGAKLICGGTRDNALFEPTILINVNEEMPVFREETFGPCAAIMKFSSIEEAIEISNNSKFGLGVSVFTTNVAKAKKHISRFEEGAVFFNSFVKSDPRLPFGGINNSGYGRELSKEGILEFANIKTVYYE